MTLVDRLAGNVSRRPGCYKGVKINGLIRQRSNVLGHFAGTTEWKRVVYSRIGVVRQGFD